MKKYFVVGVFISFLSVNILANDYSNPYSEYIERMQERLLAEE